MEIKDFILKNCSREILNKKYLENRELLPTLVDALSKFDENVVSFVGYKKIVDYTPKDIIDEELSNFKYKMSDKEKDRMGEYIDIKETVVDIYEFYFLININRIMGEPNSNVKRGLIVNTIRNQEYLLKELNYINPNYKLFTSDLDISNVRINDSSDLFITTRIFVPRLINNAYYLIREKRYYNALYKVVSESLTAKGELPIFYGVCSYIGMKKNKLYLREYGIEKNPFRYLGDKWHDLKVKFEEEWSDEIPDEILAILEDSFQRYQLDGDVEEEENTIVFDDDEEELEEESSTGVEDIIIQGLVQFLKGDTATKKYFSLHEVLKRELEKVVFGVTKRYVSKRKYKVMKDVTKFKDLFTLGRKRGHGKSWQLIITMMIASDSPTSKIYRLSSATNSYDTIEAYLTYVGMTGSTDFIKNDGRAVEEAMMGLVDPIGTSLTKTNIGIAGSLVPSIPDEFLG